MWHSEWEKTDLFCLRNNRLIWLNSGLSDGSSAQQRCMSRPSSSLWDCVFSDGRRYGHSPRATRSTISTHQKRRQQLLLPQTPTTFFQIAGSISAQFYVNCRRVIKPNFTAPSEKQNTLTALQISCHHYNNTICVRSHVCRCCQVDWMTKRSRLIGRPRQGRNFCNLITRVVKCKCAAGDWYDLFSCVIGQDDVNA